MDKSYGRSKKILAGSFIVAAVLAGICGGFVVYRDGFDVVKSPLQLKIIMKRETNHLEKQIKKVNTATNPSA